MRKKHQEAIVRTKDSNLRSLIKSILWRIIAVLDTVLIVLLFTCYLGDCNINDAISIGSLEFFFKLAFYYLHERFWQNIKIKVRLTKYVTLIKTLSWRLIATLMTFFIVGSVLSGSNIIALYIALVEVFTKSCLYYLHERFWLSLPLGQIRDLIKK